MKKIEIESQEKRKKEREKKMNKKNKNLPFNSLIRKRSFNDKIPSSFSFTQEEFAQDVSFTSFNDSPSKTQNDDNLEIIDEESDYSCDSTYQNNQLSSNKRFFFLLLSFLLLTCL